MWLRVDKFGGMVPKLAPEQLPEGASALVQNCQVSGGVLVPSSTPSPLVSLAPPMVSFGDYSAVSPITAAPVVSSRRMKCRPFEGVDTWLTIEAWAFITYEQADGPYAGYREVVSGGSMWTTVAGPSVTPDLLRYTEDGFILQAQVYGFSKSNWPALALAGGDVYTVHGPIYKLHFEGGLTAFGGPELGINVPNDVRYWDSRIPPHRIPLVYDGDLYGHLQMTDVRGPDWNHVIDLTEESSWDEELYGQLATFEFSLNYADRGRKHRYYIACPVDGDDREGPPSPVSEEVIVKPGEVVTLQFSNPAGRVNLYRSATGGDDFRLLEEKASGTTWQDTEYAPVGDVLPPYGNTPGLSEVMWHPAGFAVGYRNIGPKAELWRSDLYRAWSWPEENTVPVPENIQRIVMTGNGVIVFGERNVYSCVGSSPKHAVLTRLSDAYPLVYRWSVAQMGGRVYYATTEGLAEATAGGVRIVSGGHFDQSTWAALQLDGGTVTDDGLPADDSRKALMSRVWDDYGMAPSQIAAQVADGRLFYGPLVFDFEEELAAVTVRGGSQATWWSRVWEFEQPVTVDYVRAFSKGVVKLNLVADDVDMGQFTLYGDNAWTQVPQDMELGGVTFPGDQVWARRWQFRVVFGKALTRFEADIREVRDATDEIVLSDADVACWQNLWFRWPNRGNWCAGKVSTQAGSGIPLVFTPQGGGAAVEHTATANTVFYLDRSMLEDSFWKVGAFGATRIDQMVLWRRVTQPVEGVIREVNDGHIPPWRRKRYQFPGEDFPTALEAQSLEASLTLNVYANGDTAPTFTETITPGVPVRLSSLGAMDTLEFDFGGQDHLVTGVTVWAEPARLVGGDGVFQGEGQRSRGLLLKFPDRGRWALYSVLASDYASVVINLYADGAVEATESATVADGHVGYFDWHDEAALWEADVVTTARVRQLLLVPWERVAREGVLLEVANDLLYPPWRHSIYQWADTKALKSIWIDSDYSTEQVRFFLDGTTTPVVVSIRSGVEMPLTLDACERLRFDFGLNDHRVNLVRLYRNQTLEVGPEGLHLPDPASWRMLAVRGLESIEWACGVLHADDYTGLAVTCYTGDTLLGYGTVRGSGVPTSGAAFRLSRGMGAGYDWTVDVHRESGGRSRAVAARALHLLPWRTVAVGPQFRASKREQGIAEWLFSRYTFDGQRPPRSVLCQGSQAVTMTVYVDGAADGTELALTPGAETPLWDLVPEEGPPVPLLGLAHTVDFHFGDDDGTVDHVAFWTEEERVVTDALELHAEQGLRMVPVKFADAGSWACGMIGAGSYPVTVRLYAYNAAGVLELAHPAVSVTDGQVFRLSDQTRFTRGFVDIEGTDVRSVVLLPWRRMPVEGTVISGMRAETGIPSWLHTIYEWTADRRPSLMSYRVEAEQFPLSLTVLTGGDAVTETVSHFKEGVFTLAGRPLPGSDVRFHFGGNDGLVKEVRLFAEQVTSIPQHGIVISDASQLRRKQKLLFSEIGRFMAARVVATQNVTMRLWCDGVPQGTWEKANDKDSVDDDVFKLGGLDAGRAWVLDLDCAGRVEQVHLFGDVDTVVVQGSAVLRRHEAPFTWLQRSVVSGELFSPGAARIIADAYPVTIRLYADGSTTASINQSITSAAPVRLPRVAGARRWTADVVADDDNLVREVGIASSMARLRS